MPTATRCWSAAPGRTSWGRPRIANIGYDPVGDFTHIAMIGGESYALSAQASLGVKSFKELIALSNSKPSRSIAARPARARSASSWSSRCCLRKIANLNHVPYRGGAPLLTDFFGNHIPVAATPILPILQHAAAGTIVPLAVTSTERVPALKDVPTFAEIGYPEMNGAIWFWLAGPKSLPAPIVAKLNDEIRRLIDAPETKQMFEKSALLSMDADSPALTKYIAGEVKRWTAFVEEKGLKK